MDWISVKDRLPEKWMLCLVCAQSADANMPFRHIAFYEPGQGFQGIVPYWAKHISHWIAYPEAPNFK